MLKVMARLAMPILLAGGVLSGCTTGTPKADDQRIAVPSHVQRYDMFHPTQP
jgi:hypothetical protein